MLIIAVFGGDPGGQKAEGCFVSIHKDKLETENFRGSQCIVFDFTML